jgi:hypothetical protein
MNPTTFFMSPSRLLHAHPTRTSAFLPTSPAAVNGFVNRL